MSWSSVERAADAAAIVLRGAFARRVSATVAIVMSIAYLTVIASLLASSDSQEQKVRESLNGEVSRLVTLEAGGRTPRLPDGLGETVATFASVEWAAELGARVDAYSTTTGRGPLAVRWIDVWPHHSPTQSTCPSGPVVALTADAATSVGHDLSIGELRIRDHGIGVVTPERSVPDPLRPRMDGTLECLPTGSTLRSVTLIVVLVRDPEDVHAISNSMRSIAATLGPDVAVGTSEDVVRFSEFVTNRLSVSEQRRVVAIATVAAIAFAIWSAALVTSRRASYGRRRALGISRFGLLCLVVVEALSFMVIATLCWALVVVSLQATYAPWRDLSFIGPAAVLGLVAAGVGALPPAIAAAILDPARALRIP